MYIYNLPNELIFMISTHLDLEDLYSFSLTSKLYHLLFGNTTRPKIASTKKHATTALYWSILSNDQALANHILKNGESSQVKAVRISQLEKKDQLHRLNDPGIKYYRRGEGGELHLTESSRAFGWAIEKPSLPLLKLLFSNGFTQKHIVWSAVSRGAVVITSYLLENGFSSALEYRDPMDGFTLLHLAACNRNIALVKVLLDHGAPVDVVDNGGRSPLHIVVLNCNMTQDGLIEVVRTMLKKGVDVSLRDRWGFSALDFAIRRSSPYNPMKGIVSLLLRNKAKSTLLGS